MRVHKKTSGHVGGDVSFIYDQGGSLSLSLVCLPTYAGF